MRSIEAKIAMLKDLFPPLNGEADGLYETYLELAEGEVLRRLYPFGVPDYVSTVPSEYEVTQIRIAEYLLNKRGAIGQTQHAETGMQRAYEAGDIPYSLVRNLVPYAKVLGGSDNETP